MSQKTPGRRRAFTLIEVVLAIGVVSFAFIGIFALLPAGLGIFRQAMDTSIGSQIAQRVVAEAELTDFDALVPSAGNTITGVATGGDSGQFYRLPLRYFDDQGTELIPNGSGALAPADQLKAIYTVRVRGSLPGDPNPGAHKSSWFTSLPSSSGQRYNPRAATFLTIQVVKNPGHKDVEALVNNSTYLIDPSQAKAKALSLLTYSAVVARNGYRVK